MRSAIALDKLYMVCTETVKAKPIENDSVFINYKNTIFFSVIWLDNMEIFVK